MYADRPHFIRKLSMVLLTFASIQMFAEAQLRIDGYQWHLRPHHVAEDFATLQPLLKQAWDILAMKHSCWLTQRLKAFIVDGKWCIQTLVCNALASVVVKSSFANQM